jgi:Rrf2 family protein
MGNFISQRMRVSLKADYALRAVLDLALQRPGQPVKISEIAKRQNIPQKFLESILAGLKQGEFVASRRGVEGGYLLARTADSITAGQVLRFVDGVGNAPERNSREAEGPLSGLWRRVDDAVASVVDRTTLAELARNWRERQERYVPNWDI